MTTIIPNLINFANIYYSHSNLYKMKMQFKPLRSWFWVILLAISDILLVLYLDPKSPLKQTQVVSQMTIYPVYHNAEVVALLVDSNTNLTLTPIYTYNYPKSSAFLIDSLKQSTKITLKLVELP